MPAQKSAEKPEVKKTPPLKQQLQSLVNEGKTYAGGLFRQATYFVSNWEKYRDIIKNNYELGIEHLRRGNVSDAILRFRFVLWLEPTHGKAWYYLGRSYLADNNKPAALIAFKKAMALKVGDDELHYLIAVATGRDMPADKLPKTIPLTLLRQHFDALAADYDEEQITAHHYTGHTELVGALRTHLVPGRLDHTVLDLGCGTGLCGPLVRDVAAQITGVDISAPMLAEAMKLLDVGGKKIYDALIHREVIEFLPTAQPDGYDVLMAAGLASYIGDLRPLCAHAARTVKPGGLFAFTADMMEQGSGVRFDPEAARFVFSRDYLQAVAEGSGMHVLTLQEAPLYPTLAGWVCVLRK